MRFTLLRAFVLLAVIANLAFAAWHAGLLRAVGLAPPTQRDPQRLEQQIRPQAMRILGPEATASAVAAAASAAVVVGPPPAAADPVAEAASAPGDAAQPAAAPASAPGTTAGVNRGEALVCVEVGPLEAGVVLDGVERALAAVLPSRPWTREARPAPAQYAVFVGPVLSREAARQRRDELVKLKLSFESIEITDSRTRERLGGYALSRHDGEAAAQAALDDFRARGLRGGRVVLAREQGAPRTWLKLDRLSAAQADAVRALPAAALEGARAGDCLVGSVMSVTAPTKR
jgi:hypothetical protein